MAAIKKAASRLTLPFSVMSLIFGEKPGRYELFNLKFSI
jgi:hypothetical protein